ncbi:hypothetical protein C8Q77DRAFT_1236321 [Trametes polyzona]|nr:hypothetical protein C8Q77DRAFT_1236321 [Trametes polyzona]
MDAQRFDLAVKQPAPTKNIPHMLVLDEDDVLLDRYPSPRAPPPTPCAPRHYTQYDAQRYTPIKLTFAAAQPVRYSSPDTDASSSDSSSPTLADSVAYQLPVKDAYDDLLAYHLGEYNDSSDSLADSDCDSDGTTTPTDSDSTGPLPGVTTFRFTGASEDGDFPIDRTIVRPVPASARRMAAELSRSLASLAARSTATLRTMPSFSRLSGSATPPSGLISEAEDERDDEDEDEDATSNGVIAPPASCVASRRPSLAVAPLSASEVTESLKRLASRLVPHTGREHGTRRGHFEEAVDRYEEVWAQEERGEPRVEVFVTRTRETVVEDATPGEFDVEYGRGRDGRDGIGLYC